MSKIKPYQKFAEIYDEYINAYKSDFYERYYDFVQEILKRFDSEPDKILEIACGTGELTKFFHRNGCNIRGLDLSESMLKIARRKDIKVQKGDMRDFDLDDKFKLVLCIYDSLNYLTEKDGLESCFKSVKEHLDDKGLFIFDMNSDYFINGVTPQRRADYNKIDDTEVFTVNSNEPDRWILREIMFERLEGDKYRRHEERHIERAYKLDEVKELLERVGLKLLDMYGSLDFDEVDEETERWFFVCRNK